MTLTPVEIRHVKPSKAFVGGYDRDAVDRLLDEIVASFEDVWRDRADLADKIDQLLRDPARRETMGAYNRERFRNGMAWDYSRVRLIEAYDRLRPR